MVIKCKSQYPQFETHVTKMVEGIGLLFCAYEYRSNIVNSKTYQTAGSTCKLQNSIVKKLEYEGNFILKFQMTVIFADTLFHISGTILSVFIKITFNPYIFKFPMIEF